MNKRKIAILDYGIGNVKSISNAFEKIGAFPFLSSSNEEIINSSALILPGVGAFSKGMENLNKSGLIQTIVDFVKTGKPFMGICLGMQMLLDESEEFGYTKGLGLIKGKVIKMPIKKSENEKLPHVSWNEIFHKDPQRWHQTILQDIPQKSDVYFVHTFVASPENEQDILSETYFGGVNFCSSVHKENIYGVQFHPEKSGETGFKILKNFIGLIK